jgi:hypothetical protein
MQPRREIELILYGYTPAFIVADVPQQRTLSKVAELFQEGAAGCETGPRMSYAFC